MDNRPLLEKLTKSFNRNDLTLFFQAGGKFKPEKEDYEHFLEKENFVKDLVKLGKIDFEDGRRLVLLAGEVDKELTSHSGKLKQYDIAKKVLKVGYIDAGIFIFHDDAGHFRFSLITAQYTGAKREFNNFRRYTYFVSADLPNKTFLNQIGKANFSSIDHLLRAFSLEAVSDDFYNDFKPKFDEIANSVKGIKEESTKQDFALLFVIRTIFLGFVQKKGWLGDNPNFILDLWADYDQHAKEKNSFYNEWLKPLFFEALNTPPGRKVSYGNAPFSKKTEEALQMSPYLNGELFKVKRGVDDLELWIPDKHIKEFFDFLFQYNFTIEENKLYDEELELNPEFLGIIFERLVNKENGAVYTPRTEVDLMCRMALVKWLEKNTSASQVDLYHLLFREAGSGQEHDEAQKQGDFSPKQIRELIERLENVTVCDPAAGSGAFEVGMMLVLAEVLESLYSRNNTPRELKDKAPTPFERKKGIIANSLYGVEVKRWAVWINHLRLWLSLFVDMPNETDNDRAQFRYSQKPLLPNLGFKVRAGDSLIQRIGSRTFPISGHANLSPAIKAKITTLKKSKRDFFYNQSDDFTKIDHEELLVFQAILDAEIEEKSAQIKKLFAPQPKQMTADIFETKTTKQQEMDLAALTKNQREQLQTEIDELQAQKKSLKEERPFLWSIEFAEVFFDAGGFDIIIGNPPYVRLEDISDPYNLLEVKDYKDALQEMLRLDFPDHFAKSRSNLAEFRKGRKPDGHSDLYTYFYVRSLRLLNKKGVHVFICSNSWLDVGYGTWLQEFLLHNIHMCFIIDNQARRSFISADVNTIITIFDSSEETLSENYLCKFVAFKQPFEDVITTENLIEIESSAFIKRNSLYRMFPINMSSLIEEGSEYESEEAIGLTKYVGSKWGGKYLRAPDVYFAILTAGKEKFVKLSELANVRRGFTTGADGWFYLSASRAKELGIEKKYLKPILTNPGDHNITSILVAPQNADLLMIWTKADKKDLKNTKLLKWIIEGETGSFKGRGSSSSIPAMRPSVMGRKRWYELPDREPSPILWIEVKKRRSFTLLNNAELLADRSFYDILPNNDVDTKLLCALLNSTIIALFCEIQGNAPGGSGAGVQMTVREVRRIKIIDRRFITESQKEKILVAFEKMCQRPIGPIYDDILNKDRMALDKIVLEILELDSGVLNELYTAISELVKNRLKKASGS